MTLEEARQLLIPALEHGQDLGVGPGIHRHGSDEGGLSRWFVRVRGRICFRDAGEHRGDSTRTERVSAYSLRVRAE